MQMEDQQPRVMRIAINGCGRIGGTIAKQLLIGDTPQLRLVAINDRASTQELQEYLQRDSVYGLFALPIRTRSKSLIAGSSDVATFCEEDPRRLPWKKLRVDTVIESTGAFTTERSARAHLLAGAGRVIITTTPHAGSVGYNVLGTDAVDTSGQVLSHGSCTTTAVTPVVSMIREQYTIKAWTLFAVQSVTHSQSVVDKSHGLERRRRQALNNIVPISLDTDRAVPNLFTGSLANYAGQGVRVPTSIVHLSVITLLVKQRTSVAEFNAALKSLASRTPWRGVVRVSTEPLVSQDIRETTESAIIDTGMTKVAGEHLVQIGLWYDNEWGFASRIIDLLSRIWR